MRQLDLRTRSNGGDQERPALIPSDLLVFGPESVGV